MFTGLEAVKTICTLSLFKKKVLRLEFLIFDICQKLDAELHITVHWQVKVCMILSSKPIWVLLTGINLCSLAQIWSVQVGIPGLIKPLHCKKRVRLSLLKHIISEHPKLMMNAISPLYDKLDNDTKSNGAQNSAFPLL